MSTAAKMLKGKGKVTPAKAAPAKAGKAAKAAPAKAGKAAKAAPAKAGKAAKAAPADLIVATAQEVEVLTKEKALHLAGTLVTSLHYNYFHLGGVLSVIQVNNFWEGAVDITGAEYVSFKDFMEGEYGLAYRKGMYYVGIYNSLVDSGVDWEDVKNIGWTKLKEIAAILKPDNAVEWAEKAESLTTIQLIDYVKNMGTEGGEPKTGKDKDASAKLTTITFKVHEEQKQTFEDAIDKSKKENDTEFQTVAMEFICMGYIEGKAGKAKKVKVPPVDKQLVDMGIEKAFEAVGKAFPEFNIEVTPIDEKGE